MDLPYAEDLNYWKTSQSDPDTWIAKTKRLIDDAGGRVLRDAFGSDSARGSAAFMIEFELQGDRFREAWPVLPSKSGDERSAKRQAATMLHHHVKAALLDAQVRGARVAFFHALMLPDGRMASQLDENELMERAHEVLPPPRGRD